MPSLHVCVNVTYTLMDDMNASALVRSSLFDSLPFHWMIEAEHVNTIL